MQNLVIKNSDKLDAALNVRMTTNFPDSGFIANPPAPECDPAFLIRHERRVIIFSGEDRRKQSDLAALSYRVVGLTRNSMCTVFGNIPFIKRFESMLPSGSFLMSVAGDQKTEDNRQKLFWTLCESDPFIHMFDDLASSPYFFCARRGFNSNFCIIGTMISSIKSHVFHKVGSLVVLSDMEKSKSGWKEMDRARLISVIHEGVDVSDEFHEWFDNVDKESLIPLRGIDATGMVQGVSGTA